MYMPINIIIILQQRIGHIFLRDLLALMSNGVEKKYEIRYNKRKGPEGG